MSIYFVGESSDNLMTVTASSPQRAVEEYTAEAYGDLRDALDSMYVDSYVYVYEAKIKTWKFTIENNPRIVEVK
ncbi:hypothetical protein LCGC14_2177220 [marine sediment metagenome]|uniref:Uncharacterized protein n=1 Tax=marine sediment metagenome TaxID=412755 RepID=A0A0F9EAJ7_9ZZZZ